MPIPSLRRGIATHNLSCHFSFSLKAVILPGGGGGGGSHL